MSLPDRATPKIPRHNVPIGTVKEGKMKVLDGDTQKIRWRQGRTGFSKDFDGEPIAQNKNREGLKNRPRHSAHEGRKPHKPHGM